MRTPRKLKRKLASLEARLRAVEAIESPEPLPPPKPAAPKPGKKAKAKPFVPSERGELVGRPEADGNLIEGLALFGDG